MYFTVNNTSDGISAEMIFVSFVKFASDSDSANATNQGWVWYGRLEVVENGDAANLSVIRTTSFRGNSGFWLCYRTDTSLYWVRRTWRLNLAFRSICSMCKINALHLAPSIDNAALSNNLQTLLSISEKNRSKTEPKFGRRKKKSAKVWRTPSVRVLQSNDSISFNRMVDS